MNVKEKVPDYLEYCRYRKELDEKTLKAYRIDLCQFWNFFETNNPQKGEIEEYITELHKQYKHKTVKRKIASVRAFYNYLEEEEIVEINPFHKIKTRFKETIILPRIIPRDEIEQLINYMYSQIYRCKENKYLLRDMAIVEMLFATGGRVYEISGIRADAVNLNTGLICFMGKGGKERYVQIGGNDIIKLLKKYYEKNQIMIEKSGYFFVNQYKGRFSEQSIRLMLKKYSKLAGISRNITPHMFRHSFATYLIEEGVDVSCVQQILGHSSIKTTQIYIHVAAEKQAKILRCSHPRNKMRIRGVI